MLSSALNEKSLLFAAALSRVNRQRVRAGIQHASGDRNENSSHSASWLLPEVLLYGLLPLDTCGRSGWPSTVTSGR